MNKQELIKYVEDWFEEDKPFAVLELIKDDKGNIKRIREHCERDIYTKVNVPIKK